MIPKDIENKLYKELKRIKGKVDKKLQNERETDLMIQNAFICVFVELLYDFPNYLTVIDDYPLFNTNSLIESRPSEDAKFYQEFTETQMFQQFIQTITQVKENLYFNDAIDKYNSDKKLSFYETSDLKQGFESYDHIDKNYIIRPYFIQSEKTINCDKEALNEQLLKLYPKNESQHNAYGIMKETYRIIGSIKEIKVDDKVLKYNFYQIPGKEVISKIVVKEKPNNIALRANIFEKREIINKLNFRSCIYVNGKRPEWKFTENEKDEIREAIKDILSKIFKSEEVDKSKDMKRLLNNIDSSFGRTYFINSVYQNRTAGGAIKTINDSSYAFLSEVIFNALLESLKLEENDKNYEETILLIKSTMLYCKFNKKKQIFICDDLYGRLRDYSLLMKEAFWMKWFDIEISEYNDSKKKKKEKEKEIDDKVIMKTIEEIMKTLLKFKIKKDYVFKIVVNISTSKIKKDSLLSSFKTTAENTILKTNY